MSIGGTSSLAVRPRRAELLADQLPATDAAAAADRDTRTAALSARLRHIETTLNSCILELEQLPADPHDPATTAKRDRIRARFAELHHEQQDKQAQLAALVVTTPRAADITLLDQLPLAGKPRDIFLCGAGHSHGRIPFS